MLKDLVSVQELAELFEIDVISAEEMLDGKISLDESELYLLAQHTGVSLSELACMEGSE